MVSPFKSPCSSPKKSRKENKNPYSNRGLDKFSELLHELDSKRQSIYSKKLDSNGPPLVRFVFTNSGECVPVVINPSYLHKKKKKEAQKVKTVLVKETKTEQERETKKTESEKTEQKQSCVINENLKKITRPNHHLPVTVLLVLVFLVFFGRSVAIMCTCIAWYLVPMIREESENRGTLKSTKLYAMKKRDFARKLSIESRVSFNPRTVRDKNALLN